MGPASQRAGETAVAGVIARPPFLYLACLVLGFALDRLLPLPLTFLEVTLVRWTAGGGLIAVGLAIMAAGIRNFSHAATPVPSNRPVRALVTTGIHGWSRNPIYVGMFLLYAGIGSAARSPWGLILALPLVIILRYGVVAREETYLERRFGCRPAGFASFLPASPPPLLCEAKWPSSAPDGNQEMVAICEHLSQIDSVG